MGALDSLVTWPLAWRWHGASAVSVMNRERAPSGRGVCADRPRLLGDWHDAARGGGRVHQAQDIMAPRGWPVVSPVTGRVIAASSSELGGHYVQLLADGTGLRVYLAHLDAPARVSVGDRVRAGDVLGAVGNSGSTASRTCPHLHIQVRSRAGEYLRAHARLQELYDEERRRDIDTRSLVHREPTTRPTSAGVGGWLAFGALAFVLWKRK